MDVLAAPQPLAPATATATRPSPAPRPSPPPAQLAADLEGIATLASRYDSALAGRDALLARVQEGADTTGELRARLTAANSVVEYLGKEREKHDLLQQLDRSLLQGAAPARIVLRLTELGLGPAAQARIRQSITGGSTSASSSTRTASARGEARSAASAAEPDTASMLGWIQDTASALAPAPPRASSPEVTWSAGSDGRPIPSGGPAGLLYRAMQQQLAPV